MSNELVSKRRRKSKRNKGHENPLPLVPSRKGRGEGGG